MKSRAVALDNNVSEVDLAISRVLREHPLVDNVRPAHQRSKSVSCVLIVTVVIPNQTNQLAREKGRGKKGEERANMGNKEAKHNGNGRGGKGKAERWEGGGESGEGVLWKGNQGKAQILDAPTKILNTHCTDTPHHTTPPPMDLACECVALPLRNTKCVHVCVTKMRLLNPQRNGARFAHLLLLVSLASHNNPNWKYRFLIEC